MIMKAIAALIPWLVKFVRYNLVFKRNYKLIQSHGNDMVWEYQKEPSHYACVNCAQKRDYTVLPNAMIDPQGNVTCPACQSTWNVDVPDIPSDES